MQSNQNFIEDLKHRGLKITRHRTSILEILSQTAHPMEAEELYLALKEQGIAINLSTVYRTLETLVTNNLVLKQNLIGSNRTVFEYNRMVHSHYLICLICRKITVIDCCPLGGYEKSLQKDTQYTITGHRLDIYGYCPECKKKGLAEEHS